MANYITTLENGKGGLKAFASVTFRGFHLNDIEVRERTTDNGTFLNVAFPKRRSNDKEYNYYYIPNTETLKNLSAIVVDAYHNHVDGTPLSVTENPIPEEEDGVTDVHVRPWSGKGACVAFADITVNGITLYGITLNEANGKRWVNYPSRPIMKNGEAVKDENGYPKRSVFFLPEKDMQADIADFLFEQYDAVVNGSSASEDDLGDFE